MGEYSALRFLFHRDFLLLRLVCWLKWTSTKGNVDSELAIVVGFDDRLVGVITLKHVFLR